VTRHLAAEPVDAADGLDDVIEDAKIHVRDSFGMAPRVSARLHRPLAQAV
jgi:hypothetical protein